MLTLERDVFKSDEYTHPVKHELIYLDQRFSDWLESVIPPRQAKQLFKYWFSTVSVEKTNQIAQSYPTGGRVLTYTLPQPYPAEDGTTYSVQMDAKGVGLTFAGWLQSKSELYSPDGGMRRELMFNSNRDSSRLFGQASVYLCQSTQKDHAIANRRGLATSQVVAIARLDQFCFEGKPVGVEKIKGKLGLDRDDDFAIALRLYPEKSKVADARLNDLAKWRGCRTPNIVMEHWQHEVDLVKSLNSQRRIWEEAIAPSLEECYQDYDPIRYYKFVKKRIIHQMAHMISQGFTPCTQFSNSERAYHNHLQNVTPHGLHTELTPMAYTNRLSRPNRLAHYACLISSTHDALVTMGLQILGSNEFANFIPESLSQVEQALYRISKDKDLREVVYSREHHGPEQLLNFALRHAHQIH